MNYESFLGTLCIVSVFAFLFLVPFVLDPAISTLTHDFVEAPVTCKVTDVKVNHGKSNCSWSSCREGCTADMYHCYQVRVVYSHLPYRNGTPSYSINNWVDLERYDTIENKVIIFNENYLVEKMDNFLTICAQLAGFFGHLASLKGHLRAQQKCIFLGLDAQNTERLKVVLCMRCISSFIQCDSIGKSADPPVH